MRSHYIRGLLAAATVLALAACGGGSGTRVASVPTPVQPPAPPPPAPPPPPAFPSIFANVTATTPFATLGYESAGHPIETGSLVSSGFSVLYDAPSGLYFMEIPALQQQGYFEAKTTGDRYWNGTLDGLAFGGELPITMNVFRPGPQNWDFPNLTYTSFADYGTTSGHFGAVAFGQATPASAVPVTGSATYNAFAAGHTDLGFAIRGDVTMQFNFGAGTLSGSFDPYIYDLLAGHTPLGHYDFVNTVFGAGRPTFSGNLSRSGIAEQGTFNGMFTGPSAEELMARWTAPLPNPTTNTNSQMFGVWVGKKQ